MFTPTLQLLHAARQDGYALGAFNVYSLEGIKAVIQAAEAEGSPVILQIHPAALAFGGATLVNACLTAAHHAAIPVSVHLDHSTSAAAIEQALQQGLPSIMADGSHLDYDANLDFTRSMTALARTYNAAVEAELGRISGTEDGLTVSDLEARMTDPQQAAQFVAETGIDMLAVCIGNVHGHYRAAPQLDFERLAAIRAAVDVPLVLHGASGLPDEQVCRAIALGVCKFNVNTEVQDAYLQTLRTAAGNLVDVLQAAVSAMQAVVATKLILFGSNGRA